MKTRIIIAGGRTFNNYDFLKESVLKYLKTIDSENIQIVSGGAKGVDALGERFAKEQNIDLVIFPADWTHTHVGQISETQEKTIVTGWFSYIWDK